jgi:hypothetical protein
MNKSKYLIYDSQDAYSNDILEELKNNNLLSTIELIDKNVVSMNRLSVKLKECIIKYELPVLLLPDITIPIQKRDIKGWIKSTQLFNIKTNNIKEKQQKLTDPSPQDKLGIAKQEMKKISDNYTFIDDRNTDKSFQNSNNDALILKNTDITCNIIEEKNEIIPNNQKSKLLKMIRNKNK